MEERRRAEDNHYENILERFSTLEGKFTELNAKFDVYIAKQSANCLNHLKETEILTAKIASLSHTVNGNGEVGLVGKVDNLTTIDKSHARNYFVIYSALIVIVVGALWEIVIKKNG